jgi:hypothetical protein
LILPQEPRGKRSDEDDLWNDPDWSRRKQDITITTVTWRTWPTNMNHAKDLSFIQKKIVERSPEEGEVINTPTLLSSSSS